MQSLTANLQARLDQSLLNILSQMRALPAEGRSALQPGQTSTALLLSTQSSTGGGYLLNFQLTNGETLSLRSERPLQAGITLQLLARQDGRFDLRPVTQPPPAPARADTTAASSTPRHETAPLTSPSQTAPLTPPASPTPSADSRPPASLQTLLALAGEQLRQALPRQAPLMEPLRQLTTLLRAQPAGPLQPQASPGSQPGGAVLQANPSGPASLSQLMQALAPLLQQVPQGNQTPSAQQLQQFIPFSGLLLEAQLVRSPTASGIQNDLKFLLQQASSQLREMASRPSATLQQVQTQQQVTQNVQAALARIQVLQHTSLQSTQVSHERGLPAQVIQMDLPYSVRGDWFQAHLEIRRWLEEHEEAEAREEALSKTRGWEVRLSFELQHWGKLHTHLKLKDENLKADIWVETPSHLPKVAKQAEILAARLRRVGAEIERVECHPGTPPDPLKNRLSGMIDTRI